MIMRKALERIERWFGEFPETGETWPSGGAVSYGAKFGSNGERDYMRSIARHALSDASDHPEEDDFETRGDGQRVRRDRWETGFRSIVSAVVGPRTKFEISEIVERVRVLTRALRQPEGGVASTPQQLMVELTTAEDTRGAIGGTPEIGELYRERCASILCRHHDFLIELLTKHLMRNDPCEAFGYQDWTFTINDDGSVAVTNPEEQSLTLGYMPQAHPAASEMLRQLSIAIATAREPTERCESGDPKCGPVEFHDSEGIPLCSVCWEGLNVDSATSELKS